MTGDNTDRFTSHWRWWVLLFWVAVSALTIYERWTGIRFFALGDTDDNLRMAQVRALLAGQDWYDLRQYKLNPPFGADIHWSRLVDLPIAGLKLLLQPVLGGARAEQVAVTAAPLLPMLVAMYAVAASARRLLDPKAWALAVAILVCGLSVRSMWAPLRIDHHGWQLALLAVVVAGLVDPRRVRGGVTAGIASALSLVIGLEMLIYLAVAGALIALVWIRDAGQAPRLVAYGASLAAGTALGFLAFASYANRQPVCDALSPVWLSAMAAAGAAAVLLGVAGPRSWPGRLVAAGLMGAVIAGAFAYFWPDCLGRLEQSSPELERLWLSKVREAMPLYDHNLAVIGMVVTLPLMGLAGYGLMLWKQRRAPDRLIPWAAAALLALTAAGLLLWQTRASPAAQLLAVPGATALGWVLIRWFQQEKRMLIRVAGVVGSFMLVSGLVGLWATRLVPSEEGKGRRAIAVANSRCPTMAALWPVGQQPQGTVLTFVDLGPRLITVTRHDAIAGPYHRNGAQIIDVMRAWRGDAANARATVARHGVDYLLICPNFSESTIYRSEAPTGFYSQLVQGRVPGWLEPIALPEGSPFRMWRVRREADQNAPPTPLITN